MLHQRVYDEPAAAAVLEARVDEGAARSRVTIRLRLTVQSRIDLEGAWLTSSIRLLRGPRAVELQEHVE